MCQISRLLLWKSPQECQNVTIEFCFIMQIFYELRYTVIIEIVWTLYLKSVPAKFKKYLKHIFLVISGTSSSKLSCNSRHPSRNISCNHRHHLLQPSWQRISSTSNNQKTRVESDINNDYNASSFDKLYIRRRKWDTAGFVMAHQWKYWRWLQLQPSCGPPQWIWLSFMIILTINLLIESPRYTGGDFMFLFRFVRRRRRHRRCLLQILVHAITF